MKPKPLAPHAHAGIESWNAVNVALTEVADKELA